jgi:hypothetical protein
VKNSTPLAGQLFVLVPTLALSAYLGHLGIALGPRIFLSLGFGMVLITIYAVWRRRRS